MEDKMKSEARYDRAEAMPEIDLPKVMQSLMNSKMLFEKVADLFIKKLPGYLADLDGTIANNDLNAFIVQIHSMKSSLANIGAFQLSAVAQTLETKAKASAELEDECKTGYADLRKSIEAIYEQLK